MNQQSIEDGLRELAELAGPHQVDLNVLGGRIRRRRRTRLAVASAGAAVTLVAACGWLLPGLVSGGTDDVPAGPVGPATSSGPERYPMPAPEKLDAETQQLADVFKRVLPLGKITVMGGRGLHGKGTPSLIGLGNGLFEPTVWGLYDDGHGEALVGIVLSRWSKPDTARSPFTCTVGKGVAVPDHCLTVPLPGGGVFNLSRIDALEGAWNARWTATYAAPDGTRVVITEDNSDVLGGKPYAPTRSEPPFDAAQLQQLATSPLWKQQLAAIPVSGSQPSGTSTP